ncbi:MAG TPA: ABC transporter ATP-binding protein [candidate division Zixibacteria bacterium]|nr:ABC transporter ATP-binding protein [candidate division Zixibacteria bacterium]
MGVTEEIISVEGITKTFGNKGPHTVVALNNISFKLKKGANSILGPNGAGKSTLLKILLGYIPADSGTARVLGFDINKEGKKIRERIGYMPEHFSIIPGLNAVKQVSLLGKISGMPAAEAMQRSHETLQYVGLDEARYRKVDEFSTGMLQRLKLAQSLVSDPELLILDEPTNGLDPKGRMDMIDLIREISKEHGINILVSSHLLPDIEATCEYTTILNQGMLVAQGNIAELTGQESKSEQQRILNVRIKGGFNEFLVGLRNNGIEFTVVDKIIQIPFVDKIPTDIILKIAYDTGVQIRMMSPRKTILEDVFVHSIGDAQQAQKVNPEGGFK